MSKVVSSNNINKRNALPLTHTYRAMVKNVFWKVNGKRQVPSQHVESRPTSPSSCRFLIWKLYVSCSLLENMFFILTEQHSKAYREPFSETNTEHRGDFASYGSLCFPDDVHFSSLRRVLWSLSRCRNSSTAVHLRFSRLWRPTITLRGGAICTQKPPEFKARETWWYLSMGGTRVHVDGAESDALRRSPGRAMREESRENISLGNK